MSLRHREVPGMDVARAPGDEIVAGEARREIVSALRDLPARQRDCLVLRYYLDLTERQIADTLGISPSSVKTHTRRAMVTLRERLGDGKEAADGAR